MEGNPGTVYLAPSDGTTDFELTTAATYTGEAQTGFEDAGSVTIQARFAYGSGGTTAVLEIQTSLDQATTWFTIAKLGFSTSSQTKRIVISATEPTADPYEDPQTFDDETQVNILGDRLRALVTTTGEYAGGTVLTVRAIAR